MPLLELDLQKSFKDHLLEVFKNRPQPNIINIFAKFCNLSQKSEDFESLVTTFFMMYSAF
jgi:hypothetical protein